MYISTKIYEKYLYVPHASFFWALWSFQMFTGPSFQIKLHLQSSVSLSGFQSSWGADIVNAAVYKAAKYFDRSWQTPNVYYCNQIPFGHESDQYLKPQNNHQAEKFVL